MSDTIRTRPKDPLKIALIVSALASAGSLVVASTFVSQRGMSGWELTDPTGIAVTAFSCALIALELVVMMIAIRSAETRRTRILLAALSVVLTVPTFLLSELVVTAVWFFTV